MATEAPPMQPVSSTRGRLVAQVAFVLGLATNALAFMVGLGSYGRSDSFQTTPVGDVAGFVLPVCLLGTGLLLRTRRPDNSIGWLFVAFGVATSVASAAWTVMLVNHLSGGSHALGTLASWFGAVFSISTFSYLIIALIVRFPDGLPATAGEARLLRWLPAYCAVLAVATGLRPGPILIYSAFDNPIVTPAALASSLTLFSNLAGVAVLIPLAAAGYGMARRYRRTTSVQRLQLRWFAFGAAFVVLATALYVLVTVLLDVGTNAREAAYAVFAIALTGLPIAVIQAIASHRLYDIDRIIGRTFAYGALTAILAGLYAASIRLFNWLFVDLTGQDSEISLVLTTLVLTTSFTPIKCRLEKQAARRFRFETGNPPAPEPAAAAALPTIDDVTLAALEERLTRRIDATVRIALAETPRGASRARQG